MFEGQFARLNKYLEDGKINHFQYAVFCYIATKAAMYSNWISDRDLMIPRKDCEKPHAVKVAAEDIEKAEQVISWVRNDLAKRENLSTFDYNMVVSLSDDTISSGMFGFAAYAVVAFDKETEAQIIKNKAGQSSSQHIGKVGDRIQFDNLTKHPPQATGF